jgi:uncharacterized protein (TIGR02117 family)
LRQFHLVFLISALLVACGAPSATGPSLSEPVTTQPSGTTRLSSSPATRTIFVVSNGWHTSIVIARSDMLPGLIPEADDFSNARFLEFGWGDAEYYPAKDVTFAMTLRAALVPTPAIIHVAGLPVAPAYRYPMAEVVPLSLDAESLGRLVAFIDASFERGGLASASTIGPGLYPNSLFYPAKDSFHLLNTCNTWTARALATGGFTVAEAGTTTAEDLMRQVRPIGQRR